MYTLDDATLIQQFISGEATLAANQNLRVEPAFNSRQLLSKRGGLIACMKQVDSRQTVLLRRQSDYTALLHQLLLARHFIPTPGVGDQPGFEQYRADEIPAGYEVVHDTAKTLWKEWWRNIRQSNSNSIQIELLIFARDTWYPVRNIVCSQGFLFMTTLISEVSFQSSEKLTWLRRLPTPRPVKDPASLPVLARSLQPISTMAAQSPIEKEHPLSKEYPPAVPTLLPNVRMRRDHLDSNLSQPDLRQVLRFRQGKLYITTTLGEIVVEGNHLKFWLDEERPALEPQELVKLNDYREREVRAVNQ